METNVGMPPSTRIPPRIGNGSLTEQATTALLQMILDREFPGDRLPNEPNLAAQMGLSRTTVRAALQSLERLGVISRVPGRGTAIRPQVDRNCMVLHRLIGFSGMLEARYETVTVEQNFEIVSPGSSFAVEALGAPAEGQVLVNNKTYFADGKPAVHLIQEVPAEYVRPGLAQQLVHGDAAIPASIFEFSTSWPAREIDNSVIDLVPRVVKSKKNPLGLAVGSPFLELHETHYSDLNSPVAFSRESMRDDLVRLRQVRAR
ncbi:GntR family transcriptional regulator [Nocardia sp. R6R-6]|uniref:GntR family transcriptional regulator n=1 Tax=Nocardia sp. R6R-6 TaxID=3459303 RepID=UPI00403DE604